jgi:hypothetical protein
MSTITLASGQITKADALTIELVEPSDSPPRNTAALARTAICG